MDRRWPWRTGFSGLALLIGHIFACSFTRTHKNISLPDTRTKFEGARQENGRNTIGKSKGTWKDTRQIYATQKYWWVGKERRRRHFLSISAPYIMHMIGAFRFSKKKMGEKGSSYFGVTPSFPWPSLFYSAENKHEKKVKEIVTLINY